MLSRVSVETCLAPALSDLPPVLPEPVPVSGATGHVLAADLVLPRDLPATAQALQAGYAVTALDLMGASAALPQPLGATVRVLPGDSLPAGADSVLPEDGVDGADGSDGAALAEAIRPVRPGEGARRPGHDGRAGECIARGGDRLGARAAFVAAAAGIETVALRRPRVRIVLEDPAQAAFAAHWVQGLGAQVVTDRVHLLLRRTRDHRPKLALAPGDTAWMQRDGAALAIDLPARFDGMVAALLALALPALAALAGTVARTDTRPLARKLASGLGLSDLVLLCADAGGWTPMAPGTVTLTGLAQAQAFALLPPDSEGLPAGAPLAGVPLDRPFR